MKEQNLDERGYFIYHAVGTNDAVKSQSVDMAAEMLSRDMFTPDHYIFYQKDGEPYTTSSKIADVMNDPAFGNYGRLLFPANSGYYSGDAR